MFTANDVAKLREKTGAGMMDCKKALTECGGNFDKAVDYLREKGIASAAKKSDRIAAEGVVESYIHMKGKIGVLVEVNCETDFVAKGDEFHALAHEIALQIAASRPLYISRDEVPEDVLKKEKEILAAQIKNDDKYKGKPPAVVEKVLEGRIGKFYQENVLLDQTYIKEDITVNELITRAVAKSGEKITVRRFARFEMGEGIEKRRDDLASEVEKLKKKK